jgi:hypothetical protein
MGGTIRFDVTSGCGDGKLFPIQGVQEAYVGAMLSPASRLQFEPSLWIQ